MTNQERLISFLGFSPAANAAEGALLDLALTPGDTYSTDNSTEIKKAALEVMKVLITTADFSNTITGAQTKYDRPSILKRISDLETELGITESKPSIKGVSVW